MAERGFLGWRKRPTATKDAPPPQAPARPAAKARRARYKISDAILTGVGLGIGVASFSFPWYVFYNQEQFGPTAMRFDRTGDQPADLSGPFYTQRVQWTPQRLTEEEIRAIQLDFGATGTVRTPDPPRQDDSAPASQPFPVAAPAYSLVHVANGRAMIRDSNGFWVVERGSILPDNSRVIAIEQRNGKWVLRTSNNASLELAP